MEAVARHDLAPEVEALRNAIVAQSTSEREIRCVHSARPWPVLTLDRFLALVRKASQFTDQGGPTLHFFSDEKTVRDSEPLRTLVAESNWRTLDELDEYLRAAGFQGTLRVTQVHRLDPDVEDVVSQCLYIVEAKGRAAEDEISSAEKERRLTRFFHHHGGVNAYYTMQDSGRAIPFHRDPGDVFAFQAFGSKVWELGSRTTLYGGSYVDTDEVGSIEVQTAAPRDMLFLPRGVRHRAHAPPGLRSLHYVLMLDTSPEYWVLAGLAEALREVPLFACDVDPTVNRDSVVDGA